MRLPASSPVWPFLGGGDVDGLFSGIPSHTKVRYLDKYWLKEQRGEGNPVVPFPCVRFRPVFVCFQAHSTRAPFLVALPWASDDVSSTEIRPGVRGF